MRLPQALIFSALALCAADAPKRAPGFALPDSKMQVHDLYDYRGKPVIVEFMKTNCPHCSTFADVLVKVRQKYGDRIAILSVANPPDTTATVATFVEAHKINYPILFDSGQAAYSYVRQMHVDVPQIYLIDAQGMIYKHFENDSMSKDIFEGDGLFWELDRMLQPAAAAARQPLPAGKKQ